MAGGRHKARIAALQALYESDSSTHSARDALRHIAARDRLAQDQVAFAEDLIEGVRAKQDEIDALIADAAPAWPVAQLPPVDRNILRLAIRELLGDNGTPDRVVINEAVELAKRFGSESTARFVNGVLGTIQRRLQESQENPSIAGRG